MLNENEIHFLNNFQKAQNLGTARMREQRTRAAPPVKIMALKLISPVNPPLSLTIRAPPIGLPVRALKQGLLVE